MRRTLTEMSSLPRKTASSSTGSLAVVAQQRAAAAALQAKQSALPSPQYLDAINVLCEATMSEACALLLSEKDYEEGNRGKQADYKRLLEIEKKCREAVKVVHNEAPPAAAAAMLPPSMPTIPASRVVVPGVKKAATGSMLAAPKTMLGKNIASSSSGGKPGVVPIRRGSLAGSRPPGKRAMAQPLQRSESDDSSIGSGNLANKKARLGTAVPAVADGKGDAPPPSALDFLKKLNQDKAFAAEDNKKSSTKAKKNDKASSDGNSDEESNTSEGSRRRRSPPPNRPPPREGVRKNPARGARP